MNLLNNPFYAQQRQQQSPYTGAQPSYDLGKNIGSIDPTAQSQNYMSREANAEQYANIGKSIPIWGALYSVESGLGKGFRDKNPTSNKNQIISDFVNPSHGLHTALETGNPLDALPVIGGIRRAKKERKERQRQQERFLARQAQFNKANINASEASASRAEYFDTIQDRQQRMMQGLYGIPQQF